jgi:hypothetical protein
MTRSNRPLNRIILALLGLVLIALAAWIANREWPVLAVPAIPVPDQTTLWVAAAVALVLIVLALVWVFTRGRGRTRALVTRVDDSGAASVDARVASDFVVDDVKRIADVVGVSSTAFRVRGTVVLELRVTTRPAADVRGVVDAIRRAVVELDDVLEERIPVLLHVASGVRATHAREQRVR